VWVGTGRGGAQAGAGELSRGKIRPPAGRGGRDSGGGR
jgi:hypothetical protein